MYLNDKTIWSFGDSYTESFSNPKGTMEDYIKFKGYTPKNYVEIISEKLKLKLKNFSYGGTSNRTILSQFINVINEIKENDILIFGWTNQGRFRGVEFDDFRDIVSPIFENNFYENVQLSPNTINEIIMMRENFIYLSELCEYIKWIRFTFPKCTILNWSWVQFNSPTYPNQIKYLNEYLNLLIHQGPIEDIVTETNGLVNDYHYTENAHKILSEKLLRFITD